MKTHVETNRSAAGFTLLEMMFVVSIVVVVTGMLMGMATSIGNTAQIQATRANTYDEARRAMIYVTRQLRQASLNSISATPAASLTFNVATDTDGNGSATDVSGNIETGPNIIIRRDLYDSNGDGLTNQLVMVQGDRATVLANNLEPNEDTNGNGILDQGEDANGNGRLDRGIWFDRVGNTIRVTVQTRNITNAKRQTVFTLAESIAPRN